MVFEVESKPVAVVRIEKSVIVACMDKSVHAFFSKTKKNYSLYMPCPVLAMCKMEMLKVKNIKVRMQCNESGFADCFGKWGDTPIQ